MLASTRSHIPPSPPESRKIAYLRPTGQLIANTRFSAKEKYGKFLAPRHLIRWETVQPLQQHGDSVDPYIRWETVQPLQQPDDSMDLYIIRWETVQRYQPGDSVDLYNKVPGATATASWRLDGPIYNKVGDSTIATKNPREL